MTSPSWPVRVSPPLVPLMRVGLDEQHVAAGAGDRQAGGHAGHRGAGGRLLEDLLAPERVAHERRGRPPPAPAPCPTRSASRSCAAASRARARGCARRPRGCTRATTVCRSSSLDRDLVLAQAVALALARPQVVAGDGHLLGDGVAVEADDLHAVQQRAGDRLGLVGGRDEDDLATGRARRRGSGRGTWSSAPGRGPRAGPRWGRRASRRRPCRPRRAG